MTWKLFSVALTCLLKTVVEHWNGCLVVMMLSIYWRKSRLCKFCAKCNASSLCICLVALAVTCSVPRSEWLMKFFLLLWATRDAQANLCKHNHFNIKKKNARRTYAHQIAQHNLKKKRSKLNPINKTHEWPQFYFCYTKWRRFILFENRNATKKK